MRDERNVGMDERPQVTQVIYRPGIIDLSWGSPDPSLIPVGKIAGAAQATLRQWGSNALAYGAPQGPGPLIEWLSLHAAGAKSQLAQRDRIVLTAGASHALDLYCTLFATPGETILVEVPSYHLARRILRDHAIDLAPIVSGKSGPRPNELREMLERLRRAGKRCRFFYCVPTFNNPAGWSWPQEHRDEIIEVAVAEGLTIIEDDVYHDLWYDEPGPMSLAEGAPDGVVVRLGSFSKVVGPGLRLGWLQAHSSIIDRVVDSGLLDSGGGVNHFTAMIMADFCLTGGFDSHIERMREALCARRNALAESLAENLPPDARWTMPKGGYFTWLELPGGLSGSNLLPVAEEHGVSFLPGTTFYLGAGGERHVRLAFSMYDIHDLREAGVRLGNAIRHCTI